MSGREWQPGDVVLATVRGVPNVRIVRVEYPTTPSWMTLGEHPTGAAWHPEAHVADARPLVVIDPEDREQVERLVRAFVDALPDRDPCTVGRQRDAMQAALREFANPTPPKPDEPTGLGAVVEDRDGIRWVRSLRADVEFSTPWRDCNDDHFARHYDAIEAVRVLSEGIQ